MDGSAAQSSQRTLLWLAPGSIRGGGAGRLGYGVLAEDVIMVSPLILLGDRVGCYCCYPPDSSGGG